VSPTINHTPSSLVDNNHIDGSQRKKRANPNEALVLSTAPEDPPTHWQQVVVLFISNLAYIHLLNNTFMHMFSTPRS
jgi:hypothetical protein